MIVQQKFFLHLNDLWVFFGFCKKKKVLRAVFLSLQHSKQFKAFPSAIKINTKTCHADKSKHMDTTCARLVKQIQDTLMSKGRILAIKHNWWSANIFKISSLSFCFFPKFWRRKKTLVRYIRHSIYYNQYSLCIVILPYT